MSHLQIKNVPANVHEELRRRAEQNGLTQRDYVLRLLEREFTLPSPDDWLDEVAGWERVAGDIDTAALIRAGREERDTKLAGATPA